jgi:hypothetical protein
MRATFLTAAAAVLVALVLASPAAARGYRSTYVQYQVYVTIDGWSNSASTCALLNRGMLRSKRVSHSRGGVGCIFKSDNTDLRITIASPYRSLRNKMCEFVDGAQVGGEWTRTR